MKKLILGILAHVDAGKTTLSEGLLYENGQIRSLGRVDHQDAFLDTNALEKERGITIFSKQARIVTGDMECTLLDTPGHVDFSAEMERTLQVLDYAVLVISGTDGVQGHTRTLWRLLRHYEVPVFLFVNKMDLPGTDRREIQKELERELSDGCVDFSGDVLGTEGFYDHLAMCNEAMLESFMEHQSVSGELIQKAIADREVFPCFYGSILYKAAGVWGSVCGPCIQDRKRCAGKSSYVHEGDWRKPSCEGQNHVSGTGGKGGSDPYLFRG